MNYLGMITVLMLQPIPIYVDLFMEKKNKTLVNINLKSFSDKINPFNFFFLNTSQTLFTLQYWCAIIHSSAPAHWNRAQYVLSNISTPFIKLANALQIPERILNWNLTFSTHLEYAMFTLMLKYSLELFLF